MTTKQVNRYKCDFCGKVGYAAGHMAKHEASCTKNPKRLCRVCKMLGNNQPDLAPLIAMLPDGTEWSNTLLDENGSERVEFGSADRHTQQVNDLMPELRKAAGDCPACIMAALRQANIPVPMATSFNFTDEMKDIWTEINNANTCEQ